MINTRLLSDGTALQKIFAGDQYIFYDSNLLSSGLYLPLVYRPFNCLDQLVEQSS